MDVWFVALVSFLSLLQLNSAQTGVCNTQVRVSQLAYSTTSNSGSYRCGLFNWGRCTRTVYGVESFTTYSLQTQFGCCDGYNQSGMTCNAVCDSPACANGGTCTAPNTCNCTANWTGNDCQTDVDECTSGTHNCDHTCTNTPGSFTCSCNSGYTLSTNGYTCIDNDECTDGTTQCEVTCRNTPGSFVCECNPGYELATNGYSCQDIDECTAGTHQCAQNCQNTVGSYICSCNDGYTLGDNGRDCIDNDECATSSTNNCRQVCVNTPGSFRCDCDPGYGLNSDGTTCSDIDECATGTSLCAQDCSNTVGSYTCSCGTGYTLSADGFDCDDINECDGAHPCIQICNNTPGSYVCDCNPEYRLNSDGISCRDIDECTEGTDNCTQNCANTVGSYTCSCNSGYILDVDGFTCDDINECMIGTHICQQECNNTQGSHECACFTGFTINTDGFTCRDLDECATGVNECDQNCANVVGSYTCSCGTGWTLNPDGFRCDDINECESGAVGNITCRERCVNDPGLYHCDCFPGYTITADMVSCTDLNECSAAVDACEQLCINNVGSYTCVCNQGYTRTYDAISCLGPPANVVLSPTESRVITLIWDPPIDNEGRDGNVTGYSVACNSQQHPGFIITASANEEATDFVLMRLLPYSTYNCCLTAETTNGISPSVCIQGTSLEEAPEGPPTAINITNFSPYDLTITWEPPLVPNGIISTYSFYVTSENGEAVVYRVDGRLTSYVIMNLSPYSLVSVNMSASTSAGEGPQSAAIEMRTAQAAPSLVAGTTADVISNSTIVIEWDPPLSPNGILIYYNVEINHQLSGYSYSSRLLPSEPRAVNVTGLYPFLPYMVTVSAATVAGESDPATILVYTQHGVPIVPTISSVDRLTGQTAIVSWVPLTPDETRGLLTTLQIAYVPLRDGGQCQPIIEDGSNVLHMTEDLMVQSMASITGLLPNLPYCVAMQVGTSAGESGFSETLTLPLPPKVPFQIRLQLSADLGCLNFTNIEVEQKLLDMKNLVTVHVSDECFCHYSRDFILEDSFLCGGNPKETIFEGYLLAADQITTTELLKIIQQWILQQPELTLNGEQYIADPYCQISVEELGAPQCNATTPTATTFPPGSPIAKDVIILAIVCGGVLFLLAVAVIFAIVCCCCCRQKRKTFSKEPVTNRDDYIPTNLPILVDANDLNTLGRIPKHYPVNQYRPSYDPNDITDDDRVPLTEADVQSDYSLRGFENPVFGPDGEVVCNDVLENQKDYVKVLVAGNDSSDDDYDDIF